MYEGWLKRLFAVSGNRPFDSQPRIIPTSSCSTSEQDIGLSCGTFMPAAGIIPGVFMGTIRWQLYLILLFGEVYRPLRKSTTVAWRALCHDPYRLASWPLAVMLVVRLKGHSTDIELKTNF
jgi:hypothetical protein